LLHQKKSRFVMEEFIDLGEHHDEDEENKSKINMNVHLYLLEGNFFKRKWEKRYFELEGDKIYIYHSKDQLEHIDFIPLCFIDDITDSPPPKMPTEKYCITVKTKEKTFHLKTLNKNEIVRWTKGLTAWSSYLSMKRSQSLTNELPRISSENLLSAKETEEMENVVEWMLDILVTQEKSMLTIIKKMESLLSDMYSLKQAFELHKTKDKGSMIKVNEECKRDFK